MKTKKLLVAAFIALALLLVVSCSIPDYQMIWEIDSYSVSGSYVDVTYTLTNIGQETLYDASILIALDITSSTSDIETWTPALDLGIGSERTQSLRIYTSESIEDVFVSGARWDVDDSAF